MPIFWMLYPFKFHPLSCEYKVFDKIIMRIFKTNPICLVIISFVVSGVFSGKGYIANTKIYDCSSGSCVDVCAFEHYRLLPGTDVNDYSTCQRIRCNRDFSIEITG